MGSFEERHMLARNNLGGTHQQLSPVDLRSWKVANDGQQNCVNVEMLENLEDMTLTGSSAIQL